MRGKRVKKTSKNRLFSKIIVVFCISTVFGFAILTYALAYARSLEMDKTLAILVGFFGGELLLLALKDIFRKPEQEEQDKKERDC